MLAIRLRVSPWSARCSPRSVGRSIVSVPSDCSTFISLLTDWLSSPLGPFTETRPGLTSMLTPSGTAMGFLPMRLKSNHLPDVRDHFAAHAPMLGLVAGHHADRGGQDRGAHAAHHARDLAVRDIAAAPRAGHAPQTRDDGAPAVRVLQLDPDDVADRRRLDREAVDVALLGEDARHLALEPRCGHLDLRVLRGDRVPHAREVIGNWVGEHEGHKQ